MTPDLNPVMVRIPPGDFVMGSNAGDKFALDVERPAHRVTLRDSFALGRFPVTVREFRTFAANHAPEDDLGLPVVQVSWNEAHSYCVWLTQQAGVSFRLPTEAEWEYACSAGATTPFSTGDDIGVQDANFLYSEQGERIGPGQRTPSGCYPPNAFGLEDMHGNVCEWVADAWHASYEGAPADGQAWQDVKKDPRRVIRGGAWDYLPRLLRSTWRDALKQNERRDNVGFRLACTLDS